MTRLNLTHGYVALVDDEDYDRVSEMKWHVQRRGENLYARCWKKRIYLHQFVGPKGGLIGFVDKNPLNCQKENLIIITHTEQQYGRRKRKGMTSQFKGVSKCKATGMWRADICLPGKRINLGRFGTEIEAAQAYDAAATEYFGPLARLNEIDPSIDPSQEAA